MSNEGPDQIIPTDDLVTWKPDGCVKIRTTKEWPANRDPISVPSFVKKQCLSAGKHAAFAVKRDGEWIRTSYEDYYRDICTVAKAFIHLGLERFHGVCILGFNSPEWFLSDLGAIFAGGVGVGLYPTNSVDTNKFVIDDCNAQIFVVEDSATLGKMLSVSNELPKLKWIVQYTGKPPADRENVLSWARLMEIGREQPDSILDERLKSMAINQMCKLVYTSGTTGNPKGVMLSHDNIIWTALSAADVFQMREATEVVISYLPLSHVAGNMIDIFASITSKGTVYFADRMALKGTLLDTMKDVQPTIFFGVPRVWEKIREGMMDKAKAVKGLQKKVSTAAKQAGLDHHLNGKPDGFAFNVLGRKVVYKKVREALGLDQCVTFCSGAAPLSHDVMKYFLSLDIVILELYGMSEVTGPHTMSFHGSFRLGSVGKLLPGIRNRFADQDNNGEGEVCMWGRNVMMGYLNREDKTTEDVDGDGWMHSGDLGSMDDDGYLYITGRKKELLITAGGENVAPVPVEDNIKNELACVSNAVLIGDKQKYLTVFLTFKVVMDNDTPTNKLTPTAVDWCRALGSQASTVDDILKGPDARVMVAIQAGIDRANRKAVSNAARVQRWTILPSDLSIPGGELGPTLKLKRFHFNKKYSDTIDRLYN